MNNLFLKRLGAIRRVLKAGHVGGKKLSSATIGTEREHFVSVFLRNVLPSHLRVGTGDVVDAYGRHSGQVDGVIEYPFLPSFPTLQDAPRLYLAESVAAVIEIKSNLKNQWGEVLATKSKLAPLRRVWRSRDAGSRTGAPAAVGRMSMSSMDQIPVIAVGYTGWKTVKTLQEKVEESGLHCAVVLDKGLAASPMGHNVVGDACLAMLLETIQMAYGAVTMTSGSLVHYWSELGPPPEGYKPPPAAPLVPRRPRGE